VLLAVPLALPAQDDEGPVAKIKERELEEVRERISDLKQSMDKSATDRDRLTADLQTAEVAIAEKRLRLKDLERQRAYSMKRLAELDGDIAEREVELAGETDSLAAQVRAAYMSGNQEKLKLLLNQRDPATLGRVITYYGYLNDYRAGNIDTVSARIRELAELRSQVAAEEARLSDLADSQRQTLARLSEAQDQRATFLAALKTKLAAEGREIDRLAAQEKDLARLIAELTTFADWLAGLGLLVIVDHGDSYMTLYGYNETIVKNAGDWVAPGDVIATVGDSGGQAQPALYFEIRKGKQPVNPRRWVTRRPGD
jgi:septal ring factor EnvC (AmiA/AmiB activator)